LRKNVARGVLLSKHDILVSLELRSLACVVKVGPDGPKTILTAFRMICSTVIEIDNLLPLAYDSFWCEPDIDWKSVASRTLPSRASLISATHFVKRTSARRGHFV
jgi:hypothetical protein